MAFLSLNLGYFQENMYCALKFSLSKMIRFSQNAKIYPKILLQINGRRRVYIMDVIPPKE
jgi:hypothetical protein